MPCRHTKITEAEAPWRLCNRCGETYREHSPGMAGCPGGEAAGEYVIWNPLSTLPPRVRFRRMEKAAEVAARMAVKLAVELHILRVVATCRPGTGTASITPDLAEPGRYIELEEGDV